MKLFSDSFSNHPQPESFAALALSRTQVTAASARGGAAAADETTPSATARAWEAARGRAEYESLSRAKAAIERQLSELDEVIAFKTRKEAAAQRQPRSERPFSNFLETYRCDPDHGPVTKTVTGSWER